MPKKKKQTVTLKNKNIYISSNIQILNINKNTLRNPDMVDSFEGYYLLQKKSNSINIY